MGMARKEVVAAVERFRKYCACDDGVYDGFWERVAREDASGSGKELLLEDLHVIAHAYSDYLIRRDSKAEKSKTKAIEVDFGNVLVCHPSGEWFRYSNPSSGNPWLIGIQKRGERGGAVIEVNDDGTYTEKEYNLYVLANDAQFLRRVELGWVDKPLDYQLRVEIFHDAMKAIAAREN